MQRDKYYKKILNQSKLFTRKSQVEMQPEDKDMADEELLQQEINRPNSIALNVLNKKKERAFSEIDTDLFINDFKIKEIH